MQRINLEQRKHDLVYILIGVYVPSGYVDPHELQQLFESYMGELRKEFRCTNIRNVIFNRETCTGWYDEIDDALSYAVADGIIDLNERGSTAYQVQIDLIEVARSHGNLTPQEVALARLAAINTCRAKLSDTICKEL